MCDYSGKSCEPKSDKSVDNCQCPSHNGRMNRIRQFNQTNVFNNVLYRRNLRIVCMPKYHDLQRMVHVDAVIVKLQCWRCYYSCALCKLDNFCFQTCFSCANVDNECI